MSAQAAVCINLLPHRHAARRQREREVLHLLAGGVLCGLLLALAAGAAFGLAIASHEQRQQHWRAAMRGSDGAIAAARLAQRETAVLAARQQAVAGLQAQRNDWVVVFEALARAVQSVQAVPGGVTLHGLRQDGSRLTLQGRAASQDQVPALLLALAQTLPGCQPQLQEVRQLAGSSRAGMEFTLQLQLTAVGPGD